MVFHLRLNDSNSLQVSRTLLSILAVFDNVVVLMVSTCPLISKSSIPFINPLVNVPKAPITFGILDTFMFHSFQFPSKVEVPIILFTFFQFYSVDSRDCKIIIIIIIPFEFFTPTLVDVFLFIEVLVLISLLSSPRLFWLP